MLCVLQMTTAIHGKAGCPFQDRTSIDSPKHAEKSNYNQEIKRRPSERQLSLVKPRVARGCVWELEVWNPKSCRPLSGWYGKS